MFKVFIYLLSFPSLMYFRWDFCKEFLRIFLFLLILYNVVAVIGSFQNLHLPFGHPGYLLAEQDRYWPDRFDVNDIVTSVVRVPVHDAVPMMMVGGFLLLLLNCFYTWFRDRFLGVLTRENIPLLFSGASWLVHPLKILGIPARWHRAMLEPLLLLAAGAFILAHGQSGLGALVLINAVFYFLASSMDLKHYRDHYLKENKKERPKKLKAAANQITEDNSSKTKGATTSPIVEVCSKLAFESVPIAKIRERLPPDLQRLIDDESKWSSEILNP